MRIRIFAAGRFGRMLVKKACAALCRRTLSLLLFFGRSAAFTAPGALVWAADGSFNKLPHKTRRQLRSFCRGGTVLLNGIVIAAAVAYASHALVERHTLELAQTRARQVAQEQTELTKASMCMGVVIFGEAGTFGPVGERLVAETILNRAGPHHSGSWSRSVCEAAWGQHHNAARGFAGDYSATVLSHLKKQYGGPGYQKAVEKSTALARDLLLRGSTLLPASYTYFNTFTAKEEKKAKEWQKKNNLTCDLQVLMAGKPLNLCRHT